MRLATLSSGNEALFQTADGRQHHVYVTFMGHAPLLAMHNARPYGKGRKTSPLHTYWLRIKYFFFVDNIYVFSKFHHHDHAFIYTIWIL